MNQDPTKNIVCKIRYVISKNQNTYNIKGFFLLKVVNSNKMNLTMWDCGRYDNMASSDNMICDLADDLVSQRETDVATFYPKLFQMLISL